MNDRLRSRKFWIGLVIGIVAASGVGAALASIPDSAGVIHACYKSSGDLRVIEAPAAACKNGETPLDWNANGKAGPTGSIAQASALSVPRCVSRVDLIAAGSAGRQA